jgi:hypothetical protein
MKHVLVLLLALVMTQGVFADETGDLIDNLTTRASEMVSSAGLRSSTRLYLNGILSQGRPTPLGDVFVLKAGNRILSDSGGDIVLVADGSEADYVLEGDAFVLGDDVVIGFRLLRTGDSVFVSGFDETVALTQELRRQLQTGFVASSSAGDATEPNDDAYSAWPVEAGETFADLSIQPGGDIDWFLVSPPEYGGESLLVTVETIGETDTYIEVYGPDDPGMLIAENDDGEDQNARVVFPAGMGGRFYVRVRGYDGSVTGPYSLSTSFEEANPDDFEPDDVMDRAVDLIVGAPPQTHSINPTGDVDWLRVRVGPSAVGQILQVETSGDLDTFMTLYSAQGEELAVDDDSGGDGNARVSHLVAGRDTLFVAVEGYEGAEIGFYDVAALLVDAVLDQYEPDNDARSARELFPGGPPQDRTFTAGGDEDYITFLLAQESFVVIETEGEADTYLELLDEDENLIEEDDDGGRDYNAKLALNLGPGRYYVKVTQVDVGTGGDYTISMERYRR